MLAHNGEINTIKANRNWVCARGAKYKSPLVDFAGLEPLVSLDGSDSQSLDNMLEVLVAGGLDVLAAMRILIPPAWASREDIDEDLEAFYEYYALHSEPWDGPAGIVLCDARYAACSLDRNGLRPARWARSDDNHLIVASEAGLWDLPPERIVAKGRLGPGEMIAVDLVEHRVLDNTAIDDINRARAPFKRWLREGVTYLESHLIDPGLAAEPFTPDMLARFQKQFALTREERDVVLKTLALDEAEATGSMGDDTPIAVLSRCNRGRCTIFPPGVRPGHQSADRPAARAPGHVADDADRPGTQRVRRLAGQRAPGAADLAGAVAAQAAPDHGAAACRRKAPETRSVL
jgi:glutamate synthase (NADPH/NADH) large chain